MAPVIIFALLLGTAWTGHASVARVDVDPALHAGDIALIQVAAGTAWTVAAGLTTAGATEVAVFDSVNVVSARVNDAALAALANGRAVLSATTDGTVVATGGGDDDNDLDRRGDSTNNDSVGNAAIHAPEAWSRSTGAGVVVALMDTGIGEHPDLPAGKVVARVDFVKDGDPRLDPAGHGTHLAGVIAGRGEGFRSEDFRAESFRGEGFRGVAPDARLVSIRVLDTTGTGKLTNVVAGFDWLLKNRKALKIRVLNLSFGANPKHSYHQDLLSALAEAAWFSGVTVVAAAGNDGPLSGSTKTPGSDPFIVTAGSFDDQGTRPSWDDRESSFSSRGPTRDGFAKPDVLAPGRRVVSLRAIGSQLDAQKPASVMSPGRDARGAKDPYVRMSGTSVSSAMVAGVAALVLSRHRDYSPTKTKAAIVGSGRDLAGSPRNAVDAPKALSASAQGVNAGLLPSRLLMTILVNSGVVSEGVTWEGVSWEGVTWEAVTWESVTWESVSWEGVMWETVSWETDPLLDGAR